jgi:hypothetical protein
VKTTGKGDLGASLVLVFPLFLAYAVGLIFAGHVNGVDFVSRHVWAACGEDRVRYLAVHAVIAVGFVIWVRRTRRARSLSADVVLPLVIEATIYALTLATLIHFVMDLVPGLAVASAGDRVVASLGAGVHEELVFRLGLGAGGAWLLVRAGASRPLAIGLALVASSLLFSWAHHLGPHGEAWHRDVFVYRALAGAVFALIFWFRSLAHAVYAHVLYDVWVLVIRPA